MPTLLFLLEAGEILSLSVRTLQNWRQNHPGPPYVKLGGAVRYPLDELLAWRNPKMVIPGQEKE